MKSINVDLILSILVTTDNQSKKIFEQTYGWESVSFNKIPCLGLHLAVYNRPVEFFFLFFFTLKLFNNLFFNVVPLKQVLNVPNQCFVPFVRVLLCSTQNSVGSQMMIFLKESYHLILVVDSPHSSMPPQTEVSSHVFD